MGEAVERRTAQTASRVELTERVERLERQVAEVLRRLRAHLADCPAVDGQREELTS